MLAACRGRTTHKNSWKIPGNFLEIQRVRPADRARSPDRRLSCLPPYVRPAFEQDLRTRSKRMDAQGDEEENAARLEKEANSVRRGAAVMQRVRRGKGRGRAATAAAAVRSVSRLWW